MEVKIKEIFNSNFWNEECIMGDYIFKYSETNSEINETLKASIVNDLHNNMPNHNVKGYFDSKPTIFSDYDHLVCVSSIKYNRWIGLLGSRWFNHDDVSFLYLWTSFIVEHLQGSGIFKKIIAYHFDRITDSMGCFPAIITSKTFHPTVFKTFSMFQQFRGVVFYPNCDKDNRSHKLSPLAKEFATIIDPDAILNQTTGVLTGAMGSVASGMYKIRPKSSDENLNTYFEKVVNPDDQMFCILRFMNGKAKEDCIAFLRESLQNE